ncbi:seryl-tRNA synthetase [Trametes coccinea BRFM310]|uniref:serine--tRNA ligase n=1 Tax=Trametes coccinea (strain BRFM310) TaxID=1353009 RepID=A0A1Y2IQ15_TRAC3|nr:seryl-tRNA synthetase [Trametes coccinea BRFM310]
MQLSAANSARWMHNACLRHCFREYATLPIFSIASSSSSLPKPRLDYRDISENVVFKSHNAFNRKAPLPVGAVQNVARLYEEQKNISNTLNAKRHQRSDIEMRIKALRSQLPQKQEMLEKAKALKAEISELEVRLSSIEEELHTLALAIPNDTHPDVPIGPESVAETLSTHGPEPIPADPARDHVAICRALDLIDLEAGATVTGSSWYYLKNEGALLELALVNYALSIAMKHGYRPVATPDVVRSDIARRCGFQPRDPADGAASQMYHLARSTDPTASENHHHPELVLAGTAEIPLAGMFANKILSQSNLPTKIVGIGHAFRAEAGARGADTRGLYRVHQFTKLELFVVSEEEKSGEMMEEMRLGLPFRCVLRCSKCPQKSSYDAEAWMPGRGGWGEISSTSNCTDYQARRLHIRYRRQPTTPSSSSTEQALPTVPFAHTLNGTAAAVPRLIVALVENGAVFDSAGSIVGLRLPKALRPFWRLTDLRRGASGPALPVSSLSPPPHTLSLPATMSALQLAKQAYSALNREKPHSSITEWVEILTSPSYEDEAYDGIPELVDAINIQATGPAEASRAIRKKIKHGNAHQQYRALVILKATVENGGHNFQTSFADHQLTDALKNLAADPGTDPKVKKKLASVLAAWHLQFKDDPSMTLVANLYKQCKIAHTHRVTSDHQNIINAGLGPDTEYLERKRKEEEARKKREEEKRKAKEEKERRKREEEERKRKASQPKTKRKPFNFEQEKPQILTAIANASQAANNLVNAMTLVNTEKERLEDNERVQECLAKVKLARKPVVRYIQLVENEEMIGVLIDTNDRIIAALENYDLLTKPETSEQQVKEIQEGLAATKLSSGELGKLQERQRAAIERSTGRVGSSSTRPDPGDESPTSPTSPTSPSYVHPDLQDLEFGSLGAERRNLPPPIRPTAARSSSEEDNAWQRGSLSDFSDYNSDDDDTHNRQAGASSSQARRRDYVDVSDNDSLDVQRNPRQHLLDEEDPFADPM